MLPRLATQELTQELRNMTASTKHKIRHRHYQKELGSDMKSHHDSDPGSQFAGACRAQNPLLTPV